MPPDLNLSFFLTFDISTNKNNNIPITGVITNRFICHPTTIGTKVSKTNFDSFSVSYIKASHHNVHDKKI